MKNRNLRILFFGTPEFAAQSLRDIVDQGFEVVGVVTAPDKPSGRGMKLQSSAVKSVAVSLGLPVFQPTNLKSDDFFHDIKLLHADLGVVIAFRMLPEKIWGAPKLGSINLHGSLLPKYRGAAPIQHAIIQGESKTGLTVFFLRHEIDTGDILATVEVPILDSDDFGTLHDRMMHSGSELVTKSLALIEKQNYTLIAQSNLGNASFAPKISREFCEIKSGDTTVIAHNKIRGLSPYPGAWVDSPWGTVKIFKTLLTNLPASGAERIQIIGKSVYLLCADGLLEIAVLQLPGKPKISGLDFVNGQKSK